jgi:quinol monooxygenase YgiN
MYIRVSRGRVDPVKYEDVVRLGQDIAAAVARLPGCQSYQGGGDRAMGKIISVSTWDTEEHARFSRDALGDLLSRLQATGVQLDPPEIYEAVP